MHAPNLHDANICSFLSNRGAVFRDVLPILSWPAGKGQGSNTVHLWLLQTFPLIPAPGGENVGFSECARKHLAVKPKKGDGEFGVRHLLQRALQRR